MTKYCESYGAITRNDVAIQERPAACGTKTMIYMGAYPQAVFQVLCYHKNNRKYLCFKRARELFTVIIPTLITAFTRWLVDSYRIFRRKMKVSAISRKLLKRVSTVNRSSSFTAVSVANGG